MKGALIIIGKKVMLNSPRMSVNKQEDVLKISTNKVRVL